MFHLVDSLRTSSPGHSISDNAEKTVLKRQGGRCQDIQKFWQQKTGSRSIKGSLLIKENQMFQMKEFSAFLCIGRCKSLGSLNSFLWYAPQLSGARILCFLILSSLRAHCLGSCNVMAWWLQHPLFTDMAGSILVLRWVLQSNTTQSGAVLHTNATPGIVHRLSATS